MKTQRIGQAAEQAACQFLQAEGLQLLTANYHCTHGEIDLIMRDGNNLVFVEVRVRQNPNFTSALESVDRYKQNKIIKTANHYLQQKKLMHKVNCRFDVIAISELQNKPKINWISNAFTAD